MSKFLDKNFILENKYAEQLYFDHAKDMPIIDYHNHLPPKDIYQERVYKDITEAWLEGDHYKWRAMRALGVEEEKITGKAGSREKFRAWAESVPYTMRNPLYHWTHMELQTYFGIEELLHGGNADKIYDQASEMLNDSDNSTVRLLEKRNVEVVCSTDDPADSLEYHIEYRDHPKGNFQMFPTFRPDKILRIESDDYLEYLEKLGATENVSIHSIEDLKQVIEKRVDFFAALGCRASDYGLDRIYSVPYTEGGVKDLFEKKLANQYVDAQEVAEFKSYMLEFLCRAYDKKGWVQQFHLGSLRNNSDRMYRELGPDTGFDSMGDENHAKSISRLFNTLDSSDSLAKTILYNNNPKDNATFATMAGNYNDGKTRGKMQFGSGWWFLDQKRGMEDQINTLSEMGLLSLFVGMLTDSRSFLSFPRHDYFRRILCNIIGNDLEKGLLPVSEMDFLGKMVEDICYYNIKNYLDV
ncbi:glucuronate isomerase [Membranicola marinus]|uniref:Uronate isomerase n=1 Tax=Membranihabitans marinus TaxID=1227546 RepID=A0A953HV89_9BACT|nr:glucuronate isomerase [Membranihabitans marinus]MBY5958821.1 glucuronate isomerase [Membranihabitans marinus]